MSIDSIHNEAGYRRVRKLLAQQYNRDNQLPDIQIVRFDRDGDRSLTLRHQLHRHRRLNDDRHQVLKHLHRLWGFTVRLDTADENGRILRSEEVTD